MSSDTSSISATATLSMSFFNTIMFIGLSKKAKQSVVGSGVDD